MDALPTTSRLLIDEPALQVLPSLACAIGLNEALVLQQIHYCLRASKHERDGRVWVYNTYPEWQAREFPWWSVNTVRRAIETLEARGLLITANYNTRKGDQTKWYSIDYAALAALDCPPVGKNARAVAQDEQGSCPKWADGQAQQLPKMGRPLPRERKNSTKEGPPPAIMPTAPLITEPIPAIAANDGFAEAMGPPKVIPPLSSKAGRPPRPSVPCPPEDAALGALVEALRDPDGGMIADRRLVVDLLAAVPRADWGDLPAARAWYLRAGPAHKKALRWWLADAEYVECLRAVRKPALIVVPPSDDPLSDLRRRKAQYAAGQVITSAPVAVG